MKNTLSKNRKTQKGHLNMFEKFLISLFLSLSYFLLILLFLFFLISQVTKLQNLMRYFIV